MFSGEKHDEKNTRHVYLLEKNKQSFWEIGFSNHIGKKEYSIAFMIVFSVYILA